MAGRNALACGSGTCAHRRIAPRQRGVDAARAALPGGGVDVGVFSDHQQPAEAMNTGLLRGGQGTVFAGEPVQGLDGAADLASDVVQERAYKADYATRRSEQNPAATRGNRQLQLAARTDITTDKWAAQPTSSVDPYNPAGR